MSIVRIGIRSRERLCTCNKLSVFLVDCKRQIIKFGDYKNGKSCRV